MKKQRLSLLAVLLMALAFSSMAKAYDGTVVAPTGQTLYYKIYSISNEDFTETWCQITSPNTYGGYPNLTGSLTIPSSVEHNGVSYPVWVIDTNAFINCVGLTSVVLPTELQVIRPRAFFGCSSLTSVTWSNWLWRIGEWAFFGCSGLRSLTIPSHVNYIEEYAFSGIPHIEYHGTATGAPWGAKYMNRHVSGDFVYATTAKDTLLLYTGTGANVSIPSSVVVIADEAFQNSSISTITLPNSISTIGDYAFADCNNLTSITIPNSVTSMGEGVFYSCINLTSVSLPNSVTSMGEGVFYNCVNLTSVSLPNGITEIPPQTFYNCYNLALSPLNNSVTKIGSSAFEHCSGLTSLPLPSTIVQIGERAFAGCGGLTSLVIPSSITTIKSEAFAYCGGLTSITIPPSCRYIDEMAFSGCIALCNAVIPNTVTNIGENAFLNVYLIEYHGSATGAPWGAKFMNAFQDGDFIYTNATKDTLLLYNGSSSSVTIPSTVRVIGDQAFYQNSTLTEVTIPSGVEQIGFWGNSYDRPYSFSYCTALTTVNFNPDSCRNAYIEVSPFSHCPALSTLNIGEDVTLIDIAMFSGCYGLSSVHIPSSVTEIGRWAFEVCNLANITVDSDNPVYDSRDNCNAIIETATNILTQGSSNTVIPNTVVAIGLEAFEGCVDLTSITIPSSVTHIAYRAFDDCTGLTSISMGNSVDTIERNAFSGCSNLATITIPKSVSYIGSGAFYGCRALDTLYFYAVDCEMAIIDDEDHYPRSLFEACGEFVLVVGDSVSKIPDMAFVDFSFEEPTYALTAIISYAMTPPAVGSWACATTDRQIPLTVPCSAMDAYRADSAWSEFTNIQCMEVGIEDVQEEGNNVRVWSVEGRIFVEGGAGREVCVYDMMGRQVRGESSAENGEQGVPVPASGVYLVRIGDLPARKVMVIKG